MQHLFDTLKEEQPQLQKLNTITGSIPTWVNGSYYRNGPARFEFGDTSFNHWFDGSALIHRFKLKNGEVWYQNRFLNSDAYVKDKSANRIVVTEFGTFAPPDPCKNCFERFLSYFTEEFTDNTVVTIYPIGDRLFTATETQYINEIDHDSLDKINKVDLQKMVAVNTASAHPHIDEKGAFHNFGSKLSGCGKPTYNVIKIDPNQEHNPKDPGTAEILASIPARWSLYPGYFHSFAMSKNYYVLMEQPYCMNVMKLLSNKVSRRKPMGEALEFYPGYPVLFHIVSRKTGRIVNEDIEYKADAFCFFHHVNCYEENKCIIIDVITYPEASAYDSMYLANLRSLTPKEYCEKLPKGYMNRFVIPLDIDSLEDKPGIEKRLIPYSTSKAVYEKGSVLITPEKVVEETFEFPVINYQKYNTRKYKYTYGVGRSADGYISTIIKVDVSTKKVINWNDGEACFPSEPMFIQNPEGKSEDDGVLLSHIIKTGDRNYTYLLVLDAKDLTELARVVMDLSIPLGLHGNFIPNV